ncbi:hypothetical protein AGMMS49574_16370 [Bacteroidia bacterium]|nr:hypothetical protein AGMMS49574_16370 [Bacteroidia bacterium]
MLFMKMILSICISVLLCCCGDETNTPQEPDTPEIENPNGNGNGNNSSHLTATNVVRDIAEHSAFKGFGELLLSYDNNSFYYDTPISNVARLMPYHGNIRPDVVLDALNYMIDEVAGGETIFYNIYTEEQKAADASKKNTGLFFFRGSKNAPFAVVCPGGGFSYVGSLHEGFPLAQRISELGLNAFVIRYCIGSEQKATEDLAAAITFISKNAASLGVSAEDYSVWGGSAGARMAGNIVLSGVAEYSGDNLPKPATAVIAYTGQSTYSSDFSPAFITVAANDGIANVNTVEARVANLRNAGVEVEYKRYQTAGHGFGLGTGTDAEGWLDLAVAFWRRHISTSNTGNSLAFEPLAARNNLWTADNIPMTTNYTSGNYFDSPGFIPWMAYFPAKEGVKIKGAVLVCAGGAFSFRSDQNEGTPVAREFAALGYQAFVVNYRVQPYTMQEGAVDLARAVRFVHKYAKTYGIEERNICVMGFSAGGILCGEMLLNWDSNISPAKLDSRYKPDDVDNVSANCNAVGMIYSFYGRLSYASTDVEKFKSSALPPAYFRYGTRDPFVRQFELNISALREAGIAVEDRVMDGWEHGFGAANGAWIPDMDRWLAPIFEQ